MNKFQLVSLFFLLLFLAAEVQASNSISKSELRVLFVENKEIHLGNTFKEYFECVIPLNYNIDFKVEIDTDFFIIQNEIADKHSVFVTNFLEKKNCDFLVYFYMTLPGKENFIVNVWSKDGVLMTEYLPNSIENVKITEKNLSGSCFFYDSEIWV